MLDTITGFGGHQFTALVDEFGSQFDSNVEQQCFHDIVAYMNTVGGSNSYSHGVIESWFYWCASRDAAAVGSPFLHALA